jgi:hypothetical protein
VSSEDIPAITLTEPPEDFFDVLKKYWETDDIPFTMDDIEITAFIGAPDLWSVQFKVKGMDGVFYQLDYDNIYEAGILNTLEKN